MSALFAIALAAAAATTPVDCSWDNPGANPYTGTAQAAVDRYKDLPEKVRTRLKYRLQYGNPDEMVAIKRDAIEGKHRYGAAIRDMHFGKDKVCGTVSRAKWSAARVEPGAVYCADSHCILVPEICGNVSRITRRDTDEPTAMAPTAMPTPERELETTTVFDWTDHVGTYELGLYDAQEQQRAETPPLLSGASNFPLPGWEPLSGYPTRAPLKPRQLGGITPPREDVPVAAVPEAETWAMLLVGLGLMGCIARRRRRDS
ncbi:MHFG family PEP-CTERM protein [Duganella phyllosphaerae]|uniref:PEP-CTERM motif protein n=1 Tax=Duganella phyllosphaerae TaxID=762836 RepID=A0A1E7WUZ4_9BURK|nr:MHFG family PEP-CTERM protein [Duganella phyllosphaerae]OFA03542.1 PEP-CTERM motif protein [Duganella phyllosphaerae]